MDEPREAEQGMVTHCLFLDPADTFTVTNPAPLGAGGIGRGSTVLC